MKQMRIAPFKVNVVRNKIDDSLAYSSLLMNCSKMWDQGYTGKGMTVAVLDTGCDTRHPYLKNNIISTKSYGGSDALDRNGHGTHVAGIIKSIAPDVKLLPIKVLGDRGGGGYHTIANGVRHAIQQKVDVINMSLGGNMDYEPLHDAIKDAVNAGISVVVASGNEGDADAFTDEICYPAFYPEVIEVGAIDFNDNVAEFSNSNIELDVCCFGVDIASSYLNNQYAKCSGTSQATPQVSGALCLLKQKFIAEQHRVPSEQELFDSLLDNLEIILGQNKRMQGNGKVKFK